MSGCKKAHAMLSVTHKLLFGTQPDYRPLADAPLLEFIRRGIRNQAAPIPHVASWWSISKLFAHLATMALDPVTCPLQELRDKAIVLLKLDSMARSEDIANLDEFENGAAYASIVITFHESKHQRTRHEMHIRGFAPDARICTVTTLRAYFQRTLLDYIPARMRKVDGREVKKYPLFRTTTPATKGSKLLKALTSQRISNITRAVMTAAGIHERYKAHTTRGAAASKCFNLGVPLRDVLARGRWLKEKTFFDSYLKGCRYLNVNPAWAQLSVEDVLRLQVIRA